MLNSRRSAGVIGLGEMGTPIAKRLYDAGILVGVYNRTIAKATRFKELGVHVATTPRALAEKCDIVLSIVTDDIALTSVMLGPNGVLSGLRSGGIVADLSTTGIDSIMEVHRQAEALGIRVLDAPVSGIPSDAAKGDLTIIAGGKKEVFDSCLEVFKHIASSSIHVGDIGAGRLIKYANNILVTINLMGALEATAMITKTQVDPKTFVQVIKMSRGNSWAFERFIPILFGSAPENHRLALNKDLDIVLKLASQIQASLPFTSLAKQFLQAAKASEGDNDPMVNYDSLVKVFEYLSSTHILT